MKLRYVLLLIFLLAVLIMLLKPEKEPAPALDQDTTAPTEIQEVQAETPAPYGITCAHLSEKLAVCEPYGCEMPHPAVEGFMVRHTVEGVLDNGLCVHLQTAPQDMLVVCNYSPEMRVLVAKTLRPDAAKPTQEESKILSAGFDAECEVVNSITGEVVRNVFGGDRLKQETGKSTEAVSDPETTEQKDDQPAADLP